MIWPFKKRETISFEDYVQTLPMPECGNPVEHYTYIYDGAHCMDCQLIEADKLEQAKEDRLAQKIAEQVVALIKETK